MSNNSSSGRISKKRQRQGSLKPDLKKQRLPLSHFTLAISTLDVKGQQHTMRDVSYKGVAALCSELGASATGQVHKRVNCLITTSNSLANATQRVRKALKLGIPIVDIEWLHACKSQGTAVGFEPYQVENKAKIHVKEGIKGTCTKSEKEAPNEEEEAQGWSEAVSLGCCCVCHENMDDNCPWCTDCSINIQKGRSQSRNEQNLKSEEGDSSSRNLNSKEAKSAKKKEAKKSAKRKKKDRKKRRIRPEEEERERT